MWSLLETKARIDCWITDRIYKTIWTDFFVSADRSLRTTKAFCTTPEISSLLWIKSAIFRWTPGMAFEDVVSDRHVWRETCARWTVATLNEDIAMAACGVLSPDKNSEARCSTTRKVWTLKKQVEGDIRELSVKGALDKLEKWGEKNTDTANIKGWETSTMNVRKCFKQS